jgi:hypothetical protein
MYLKDPTTKEPSPTLTMVFIGVSVALGKLLIAGSTVKGITFGEFSGADFALVVAPFIALYGHKRQVNASSARQSIEQEDAQPQNRPRKRG